MRTPGRCTNHEACWLADGNRDIWVSVADDFTCPVCRTPLEAPPMTAISHRGFGAAMGTSMVLMLVAGALGFGLVQVLREVAGVPSPRLTAASFAPARLVAPSHREAARVMAPAVPAPPLIVQPPVAAPVPALASAGPPMPPLPVEVVIGQVTLQQPVPQTVSLPVAVPGPLGPEEFADSEDFGTRWHRRRAPTAPVSRTYVLPAPGEPDHGAESGSGEQPYSAGQSDERADDASRQLAATLSAEAGGRRSAGAPRADAGAVVQPDVVPSVTSDLAVPAVVRLTPEEEQPAERVDAEAAAMIDGAKDAPERLGGLAPAPPEKLAVPAYPEIAAVEDRPGRVKVGCTISIRGEPTGCEVRAEAGGTSFVSSVLNWLNSGSVRYKPHVVRGTPVPEPRLYNVKFEPD
jgi:hypothetical protein